MSQNYWGGRLLRCAVLAPSPNCIGMSQLLRAVRLVSDLPHDVLKETHI